MTVEEGTVRILSIPVEDQLTYNPEENIFFVNFENLYVKSSDEKIKGIRQRWIGYLYAPVNRRNMMDIQDDLSLFRKLLDHAPDLFSQLWI